ncbi:MULTISPECIES: GntR family transcriptional regulator [Streptomyces]|uniref:GntR family transcriptional regulator n=1 Tax=Streptomyces tsukubensis (strain DSM 42081 / NBRC 108919 / NRRL 18488 / 9993) TaxID=1114943 RepID=I2N478_STRT9|nr:MULTISPECIES: GntR family transcriptional regulator [Streptomyces]AZK95899.1 GntR family transcriptional regulator [Streptomyces tsukubensis]EIF91825.1 GntR family transcriptional regulator [Streptomyces tsukubensis NRRL18488]MYS67578.1 UTRA domain-containing protein [Streptomyces sp. SID5473]QKM68082.1 GntR family transcriptional regulator [Streptomyces tsukubensis NRRL18488]TAI44482.1 GntR family transcriptional regulator [Streptomyces tsukubensis]
MSPKWRELADRLAGEIRSGEYAPGDQLPHIRDLVEAGEGSKTTVHQAYKALEAEGLVTSSRGHGTVVRQQAPLKRLGIARYDKAKWRDSDEVAFIADRVASGRAYKRGEQTQTISLVEAPAEVAAAHGLPVGAEVYARARLVKEGQQPTHTLTSYYRPEHVEGTRLVDPTPGPAGRGGGFRVLYDAGYEIDHMKEELFARVPTPDEVALLLLPPGEPVVELHRTTYTADGTVVEFAIGVHAATRFAWAYDFKVPDSAAQEPEEGSPRAK